MGRDVCSEEKDALGPLRWALGRIASLNEAVTQAVVTPEEGRLRDLGRKLGVAKKELMALDRDMMTSQAPALALEAHDLAREAEDVI
jgi:molybdenum-dependent DNA-binding transcriptional regulator ModE